MAHGKDADDSGWPWQVAIYRSTVKADACKFSNHSLCSGTVLRGVGGGCNCLLSTDG